MSSTGVSSYEFMTPVTGMKNVFLLHYIHYC
jgi:hypothetical protein